MVKTTFYYESQRDAETMPLEFLVTTGTNPHIHKAVEILCITSGTVEVFCNGDTRNLHEGDVFFAESYDVHGYKPLEKNTIGKVLIIPNNFLSKYRAAKKDTMPETNFLNDENAFAIILNQIEIFEKIPLQSYMYMDGIATSVMAAIRSAVKYLPLLGSDKEDLMPSILKYIHENYTEDITLESLSKKFGYSPNHFSHLFNAYMPVGLKQFVNTIRVENATMQLIAGKNVLDAAMDAGFNSFRTFYRCFSERYNCSPQQYLDTVGKTNEQI